METPATETPHRPPREGSRRALGVEAHQRWLAERRGLFTQLFDFTSGKGLEIGALDTAAVDPSSTEVQYVDVYDRAGTVTKYADDDDILLDLIPETTYPLWDGERVRTLGEAAGAGAPFDWVLASHVVEHVPNLVAWLADISNLTTPDGALVLAAPDRRFTFDCHRPPTTVGQVIEAYLRGDLQPGPRAVYDHTSSLVLMDGYEGLAAGLRPPGKSARMSNPVAAFEAAKQSSDEYIDLHVWSFTVHEFIELIAELRQIGLSDWYVSKLGGDPRQPEFEFRLVLRKVPSNGQPYTEVTPTSDLPAWLTEYWQLRETAQQLARQSNDLINRINSLTAGGQ